MNASTGNEQDGQRGRGRPRTGVREAALSAAAAVLSESGAAGFTTKAVAQRAGVAESSVFYHFGDRVGLLQEVVFVQVGGYQQLIDRLTSDQRPASLQAGLRRLLGYLTDYFERVLPCITTMQADPQTLATFRERSKDLDLGPHRAIGPVRDYLRFEQAAGRVGADADPGVVATFIVGTALQRAQLRRFGGRARSLPSDAQITRQLLRLLSD